MNAPKENKFPPRFWVACVDDETQIFPNPGMAKKYGPWAEIIPSMAVAEHDALLEAAVSAETARCLALCEVRVREERAKAFEEAIKYVRWKIEGKGKEIHPAAKCAYEESILTIQTADMPRSSVMDAKAARAGE